MDIHVPLTPFWHPVVGMHLTWKSSQSSDLRRKRIGTHKTKGKKDATERLANGYHQDKSLYCPSWRKGRPLRKGASSWVSEAYSQLISPYLVQIPDQSEPLLLCTAAPRVAAHLPQWWSPPGMRLETLRLVPVANMTSPGQHF